MPKQRVDHLGNVLPPCIHWKHGRYYMVKKNQWLSLDVDFDRSLGIAKRLSENMERGESPHGHLVDFLRKLHVRARNNAQGRKGKEFTVTVDHVIELASANNMRCMVSGTPFSLDKDKQTGRRPLAPSIDRIDSSIGYIPENVRVVCMITNYAMNVWGESYLRVIAENMTRNA